ncbi:AmmeMemoRadiSam system radical SAM enzyme [candidate division KSB1 bacterium]
MLNHNFFRKEKDVIVCEICPNFCKMKEGQEGICFGRKNTNGELVPLTYGEVSSTAMDPIEKKPLYHLFPGKSILSIGTYGCNFRCVFCQNCEISQSKVYTQKYSIDNLIRICRENKSFGVAYTYNEPVIWYEFVLDAMKRCKDEGLCNVLVSNGYINEKPFMKLLPYIDGINIDLKSIRPDFYLKYVKGKLEPVKRTIELAFGNTVLEITNLLITDLNDSEEEMHELVDWASSVSPDLPLHISRYFPRHKLNNPATSIEKLTGFYEIAVKKLNFVYVGNAFIEGTSNTFCPGCKKTLIEREGYRTSVSGLDNDGKCENCGKVIYGNLI